jgi:hypothetical protein
MKGSGIGYFIPIVIPLGYFVLGLGLGVGNLIFRGGVALYVRDGRLIFLFESYRSISLDEIKSIKLEPEGAGT